MMKTIRSIVPKAMLLFLVFTVTCGVLYTAVVTGLAQVMFPKQANGSMIEVDGKKYGSERLGQQYTGVQYMWGRIMNIDVATYQDKDGKRLMYAVPSNLSPASEEYETLVAKRVEHLRLANPDMEDKAIPVDLVTGSGSGLDPDISLAAAKYQIARIATERGLSEKEVTSIIKECKSGKFLGLFGEETVNVLKVNLTLDGIL